MESERRQCKRIEGAVCAWLSFKKDGAAYGTLTVDLGANGAQFSSLRQVALSEKVSLNLQLPSFSIACEGNVCWVNPMPNGLVNFGINFTELSSTDRSNLEQYIEKIR